MIELFSADTPNGKKISPFSKIPLIIDHKKSKTIFESGAILIYLANESGKFYNTEDRLMINQWLMAQMGYIGPMLGQHHQFHHYNPGKLKLILSGFHEGALAARACFKLARPNEKYRFEFTTSSKTIKDRLGVKSD